MAHLVLLCDLKLTCICVNSVIFMEAGQETHESYTFCIMRTFIYSMLPKAHV